MRFLVKTVTVFFVLNISFYSFGQMKHDYQWVFGYDTESTPGVEGTVLNFNKSPLEINAQDIGIWLFVSNATIANKEGNLLFYSNGCSIYNQNFEEMENGDSINPGNIFNSHCYGGYPASVQSCLILPKPESETEYYLFHKQLVVTNSVWTGKLNYSLVDMFYNNGLGKVMEKNIPVVQDTLEPGMTTAIKHSNGTDWWIIAQEELSNTYYQILLTANGVEEINTQSIGETSFCCGQGSGAVDFSPDGTKFARYDKINHLYLYDFDRGTGQFSNFEKIMIADTIYAGGVAISSNSQFLYVSALDKLYQFDLDAENIQDSKITVGEWDGFIDPFFPTNFYQMQLAPDCRIYMNSANGVTKLHVINYPNRRGLACEFEQHTIQLANQHQASMPHFPYYRMDTEYPICDSTLFVTAKEVSFIPQKIMEVFPSPANDFVNVKFGRRIKEGKLVLTDILGKPIFTKKIKEDLEMEVILDDFPSGLYQLSLFENEILVQSKKISIVK